MSYNRGSSNEQRRAMLVTSARRLTNERSELSMATLQHTPDSISIPLTKGYVTVVDAIDGDLAQHRWHVGPVTGQPVYALRSTCENGRRNRHVHHLHRVVLERALGRALSSDELVDHIDGDGLNNRRANLRIADSTGNARNAKLRSDNKSGYRGVTWHEVGKCWRARIRVDGKLHFLGLFQSPEEAYKAYLQAAEIFFGEFMPSPERMKR